MPSPHGWSGLTDRDPLATSDLVLMNGVAALTGRSKMQVIQDSRSRRPREGHPPQQEDQHLLEQVMSANKEIEDLLLEGATRRAIEYANELDEPEMPDTQAQLRAERLERKEKQERFAKQQQMWKLKRDNKIQLARTRQAELAEAARRAGTQQRSKQTQELLDTSKHLSLLHNYDDRIRKYEVMREKRMEVKERLDREGEREHSFRPNINPAPRK